MLFFLKIIVNFPSISFVSSLNDRSVKSFSKKNKTNLIKGGHAPPLKGVFAKNERGYRLNAIKKRF